MHLGRPALYIAGWLVAVAVAVTVGIVTVTAVGASMRGRGPIGSEQVREATLGGTAPSVTAAPAERDVISGEYGEFEVGCQGAYAVGIEARPAPDWRVVSFEPGPDDDVEAVFSSGDRSAEVEVFCNRGRPTLAELEMHRLGED